MKRETYPIRPVTDCGDLLKLYYESGLDGAPDGPTGEVIGHLRCDDDTGRLVGGATIVNKGGLCVLDYLAVRDDMRGCGIGARLLGAAEDEAKRLGIKTMWLCGKVPAFYKKYGWVTASAADAPLISHCQSCPKFHVSCSPEIMKKTF